MAETLNYFNYFTEVEEYFLRKRGAHLLVSPLDWAIVETWQKAGIPIGTVLQGIDRAFESWARSRRGASGRPMKTLAYCVDAVMDAAAERREAAAGKGPENREVQRGEPFSREELQAYFRRNRERLAKAAAQHAEHARPLDHTERKLGELSLLLETPGHLDLEDLERRLTVLEEKLAATLTAGAEEELLVGIRREMDRQLATYRRRMTAEQLAQLQRQYTQKRLFEHYEVPRLSLFYLT